MKLSRMQNIIKEEIQLANKVLKENSLGNNEFITEVEIEMDRTAMKNAGMIDTESDAYLIDIYNAKVPVKWKVEFEIRGWGIKSVSPIVPDQEIHISYQKQNDDSSEDLEATISLKNVETDISNVGDCHLYPHQLSIDSDGATLTF